MTEWQIILLAVAAFLLVSSAVAGILLRAEGESWREILGWGWRE